MPPVFSGGTWGQQVSQRFPVKSPCLLEKLKGGSRNRRQARNWKRRSRWGTEGSKKDAAAAKAFKLRMTMNKLEWTEEPQIFANEFTFLCSAIFPARFLFKSRFASTPTSFPGEMAYRVSPPFSICSSGHLSSKTRFFSLWLFLGGKVTTGFSWALKSESILWKLLSLCQHLDCTCRWQMEIQGGHRGPGVGFGYGETALSAWW
jgi:hypothetical protein